MLKHENSFVRPYPLRAPVLFLTFNRLDTARQVFDAIRQAQPSRLYLASDGPRKNVPGEKEKVAQVRNYVLNNIDWKCEVKTLFRENNLGCKAAVSGAITWFFDNEESGIILEDDCLPSQSFFWFCDELLEKYKDDTRVMHVAGMTYVPSGDNRENYSYHFVRVGGIWGWASWRRAWRLYEPDMESYPAAKREKKFRDLFVGEPKIRRVYEKWFDRAFGTKSTWDYQWTYSKLINSSINIMPSKNLVRNIGLGSEGATHTRGTDARFTSMQLHELKFPIKHPKFMVVDRRFNSENFSYVSSLPIAQKIRRGARRVFKGIEKVMGGR